VLRLGGAIGTRLTVPSGPGPDLLLLAGGTGLAPMKAVIEDLVGGLNSRAVTLVMGATNRWDLYDQTALTQFASQLRWFDLITTVAEDPVAEQQATAVEAALRSGSWHDRRIYICGSPSMVAGSRQALLDAGYAPEKIHVEQFDDKTYAPLRAATP